jgi:hypothetical protein
MFPSAVVYGTAEFEWGLEGERFLLQRLREGSCGYTFKRSAIARQ